MSTLAAGLPGAIESPPTAPAPAAPVAMNPRTRRLLHGAIVPTLLMMAWPNILVMTAQASTGLIETWWVSRLGTDALAGMALVFPGFMMMQMLSAGAGAVGGDSIAPGRPAASVLMRALPSRHGAASAARRRRRSARARRVPARRSASCRTRPARSAPA